MNRDNASGLFADKPNVANCNNCGAPMHRYDATGMLVCDHCGTQKETPGLVRHLEIVKETARSCPTCKTPLSDSRLDGYALLLCTRCLGMLIGMRQFASVIDAARAYEDSSGVVQPRGQNPGERLLDCPECGRPMLNHFYEGPGNLVIDTCERCMVNWLDPGELRRIARAPHGHAD